MIGRRELLAASVLGVSAGADVSDRAVADVIAALHEIKTTILNQSAFSEIAGVRQRMLDFLRAQGKFPDFVEVGTDVWMAAYDWHVKHLQPITLGRDNSGRYTLALMQTQLIMRTDSPGNFVGTPFDNR